MWYILFLSFFFWAKLGHRLKSNMIIIGNKAQKSNPYNYTDTQLIASSHREHFPTGRNRKSPLSLHCTSSQSSVTHPPFSSLSRLQLPTQLFSSRLPSLTMPGLTPLFSLRWFFAALQLLAKLLTHTNTYVPHCLHCIAPRCTHACTHTHTRACISGTLYS